MSVSSTAYFDGFSLGLPSVVSEESLAGGGPGVGERDDKVNPLQKSLRLRNPRKSRPLLEIVHFWTPPRAKP